MRLRFKRIALRLLPPIVIDAIRRIRGSGPAADGTTTNDLARNLTTDRKFWGLNDLDQKIEKYLNFDSGYYVELGANDGKLASNTLYYERNRNWKGVLIEPAPNLYLECRKNRSDRNSLVCAACVSFQYPDEFVKMIYSDSMSVSLNVESDIGDNVAHAELGRQFLKPGEDIFQFGALARTLNSILIEAKAPALIDFLSLDVEGAEIEVLKGLNHDNFKFRFMLVECRDVGKLERYLKPLNYGLVEKFNDHDYMFALRNHRPVVVSRTP